MKQTSEEEFREKVVSRLSAVVIALAILAFSAMMSFAMFVIQNYKYINQFIIPLVSGVVILIVMFYLAFRK